MKRTPDSPKDTRSAHKGIIGFRVSDVLRHRLEAYCNATGADKSAVMTRALELILEEVERTGKLPQVPVRTPSASEISASMREKLKKSPIRTEIAAAENRA